MKKTASERALILIVFLCLQISFVGQNELIANEKLSKSKVLSAMKRASKYFRETLAYRGGYVYLYSVDLRQRWGEGAARPTQIWVEPPGTPAVGLAFLNAYQATDDKYFLEASRETAQALILGQLQSGGWANQIDFKPYKNGGNYRKMKGGRRNRSSLDDDQTQASLKFLMQLDKELRFKDKALHETVEYALKALLDHQFPNGAFPQGWDDKKQPDPKVTKASFPDYDWRTERRIKEYWDLYTLNDDLANDVADALILAHQIYKKKAYKMALEKLGDFLILAQLPDPQPAWAQQYHYDMKPSWARKFEPAAISSRESIGVIEALLKIYSHTKNRKYLKPIPRALKYLKASLLSDGQMPRFYELKTNKPLYMYREGKAYFLTYDDSNLPRHYSFKWRPNLSKIEDRYKKVSKSPSKKSRSKKIPNTLVIKILKDLDEKGRWVSMATQEKLAGQTKLKPGEEYISSSVFIENVKILSDYLSN